MKKFLLLNACLCLLTFLWVFLGIEEKSTDHAAYYDFFILKHFTNQRFFYNPVKYGESDFRPYQELGDERKSDFQKLCYYRYDLSIDACEILFNPDFTPANRSNNKTP